MTAAGAAPAGPVSIASQTAKSPGRPAAVAIVAENNTPEGSTPGFTYSSQNVGTSSWQAAALPGGYGGQTDPEVSVAPDNTVLVTFTAGLVDGSGSSDGFWVDQQSYLSGSWSELHVNSGNALSNPQIVEQNGGNLIVAADGFAAQGTYFSWSPADDLDTCYAQTVSGSAGTTSADGVDLADDPAQSEIAVTAPNGSCDDVFLQPYGTSPWNSTQLACPGVNGVPQILAQASGALVATDENNSGQVYFSRQDGSGKWHSETSPGPTTVIAGAAVLGSYGS